MKSPVGQSIQITNLPQPSSWIFVRMSEGANSLRS
jgi:hypothetical protein